MTSRDYFVFLIGGIVVSDFAANALRGKIDADFPAQQASINAAITLVGLLLLGVIFVAMHMQRNRRAETP